MKSAIEITDVKQFRDIVDAVRQERATAQREVSRKAGVTHAAYWLWMRSSSGDLTLSSAIAYAKVLGLRLFVARDD